MNWPIFTRILSLIGVFQVKHTNEISNLIVFPPQMLQAYFNNVFIRNHIMLVRHLMLEVNKGWHFRDTLIILLLNTTAARLQTFMTLDLSSFFFLYFILFYFLNKQVMLCFQCSLRHCTCNAFGASCLLYNSRSRQLLGFLFSLYPIGELTPNIQNEWNVEDYLPLNLNRHVMSACQRQTNQPLFFF